MNLSCQLNSQADNLKQPGWYSSGGQRCLMPDMQKCLSSDSVIARKKQICFYVFIFISLHITSSYWKRLHTNGTGWFCFTCSGAIRGFMVSQCSIKETRSKREEILLFSRNACGQFRNKCGFIALHGTNKRSNLNKAVKIILIFHLSDSEESHKAFVLSCRWAHTCWQGR